MNWRTSAIIGSLMAASFLAGQILTPWIQSALPTLAAQGRGPVNPAPPDPTFPTPAPFPTPATAPTAANAPIVYPEDGGQSAAANGFLAVTGSYGVGTSVLYLVDTVRRQLAVYEARGGSTEQRRVVLVGARKLDLDLMLEGYNDRSEYDYRRLKEVFDRRGANDPDVTTGLETDRSGNK